MPLFEWGNTSNGEDVDLAAQDDTYPIVGVYVQESRDFYNDTVALSPETDCYETTYQGDDGLTKSWRYRPYVHPHPLVQLDSGG